MIHNPQVNADLQAHGAYFLTGYEWQCNWFHSMNSRRMILSSFPHLELRWLLKERLKQIGIQTEKYDTTCPFVEKFGTGCMNNR